jgi:UDP-glucuronate 4-epimerase
MAGTTGRVVWRQGDIRDYELLQGLFQEQPIDLVIHLAAMAGVRPSIERPRTYSE